jgi:hypothetical protein
LPWHQIFLSFFQSCYVRHEMWLRTCVRAAKIAARDRGNCSCCLTASHIHSGIERRGRKYCVSTMGLQIAWFMGSVLVKVF